jgi:integrase
MQHSINHFSPAPADGLPASTRACCELPDLTAVRAVGIDLDLESARVVLAIISRLVAAGRSSTRAQIHATMSLLVTVCRQDTHRYGEAPLPNLPTIGWPMGTTAFERLGITNLELEEYWLDARMGWEDACLPLRWALGFMPAAIWPAIALFANWGPDEAFVRLEAAIKTLARQPARRGGRRKPAGTPLADTTINNRITGIRQLMNVLIDLRTRVAASPNPALTMTPLAKWTHKPPRIEAADYGAKASGQDNSGPPIADATRRLAELSAAVDMAEPQDSYRCTRGRLLLVLLLLLGVRANALRATRVSDYLPEHVFADGERGPALRLFPKKRWRHDQPLILPLPPMVARWVEEWIACAERHHGEPQTFLFPGRKPGHPLTQPGFYNVIAGSKQGMHALIPLGHDPCIGWRVHGYLHTAYQLAVRAASICKSKRPIEFGHVLPDEFAKALVGHKLDGGLSSLYRDLNQDQLLRAVITEMWSLIWLEAESLSQLVAQQAQTASDPLDVALAKIEALQAEIRRLRAEPAA